MNVGSLAERQADNAKEIIAVGQQPRARGVSQQWQAVEPYLDDFGITRVANLTHLDRVGIPVYMAAKPAGRLLSSGCGKGLDDASASLSAVMEAIEQTYWENYRPDPRIAAQREFVTAGEAFVDVGSVAARRDGVWNLDTPIPWVQLWDLVVGELVWAPAETVYAPSTEDPRHLGMSFASSNGLASGARALDAVLAGLYEVVERDSISVARFDDGERSMVASADMSCAHDLIERFAQAGLTLELCDLTSADIGLATVRAVVSDTDGGAFVGYGTSIDAEVALVRALTEAAQSRCVVISGSRDDIFDMQRRSSMRLRASLSSGPHVGEVATPVDTNGTRTVSSGSVEGDLALVVERLAHAGFDRVLVHRHSDVGDPAQVVRVVVPGLEGLASSQSAPGRRAQHLNGAPIS